MQTNVNDWLSEGRRLIDAGLAECEAIDRRIADLRRQRELHLADVAAARRIVERSAPMARTTVGSDAIAAALSGGR